MSRTCVALGGLKRPNSWPSSPQCNMTSDVQVSRLCTIMGKEEREGEQIRERNIERRLCLNTGSPLHGETSKKILFPFFLFSDRLVRSLSA